MRRFRTTLDWSGRLPRARPHPIPFSDRSFTKFVVVVNRFLVLQSHGVAVFPPDARLHDTARTGFLWHLRGS